MSGVLEALSEEECYLYAILSDHSGLDQLEFLMVDEEQDDACWRAWDFQHSWWRDDSPLQIDRCARSLGKSMSIMARAVAFPFVHPGNEMVITAPEKVHLDAITSKTESTLLSIRLTREMLKGGGGRNSFRHQPFQADFKNGARIMGRIPQRDGKGMKGTHPLWLELDEGQDFPAAGWQETIETLKRGVEGAVWRAHGVTRGVRDHFYRFTQPNSGWVVHTYPAMIRPTWTEDERKEKELQYGSADDPDYRRNVLGLHGDSSSFLFPLHRLMQSVDQDETSEYNLDEFLSVRITDEVLQDHKDEGGDIATLFEIPVAHLARKNYPVIWMGADIGFTVDPTEVAVYGEEPSTKKTPGRFKLLARFHLKRISAPDQAALFSYLIERYLPRVFAMDSTGVGLPVFQFMQQENVDVAKRVRGYNFSSKILVELDATVDVDEDMGEDLIKEAGIQRNVKEFAQDSLRTLVDNKRLLLPWDRDIIGQFQGATATQISGRDQYGRRRVFSGGDDHFLDASRMAALAQAVFHIEELVKGSEDEPVLDTFFAA